MLDLERADAGGSRVVRLHACDDAAPVVAKPARLVEVRVMACCNESAVADKERRIGHKCRIQPVKQGPVARQVAGRPGEHRRQVVGQGCSNGAGLLQTGSDRAKVSGAAALQRQTRERAFHVGCPPQGRAQRFREVDVFHQRADGVLPTPDGVEISRGRRHAPFEQARTRCRHRPVNGREQRSRPTTCQRLRQFEAAPGRGVDLHDLSRCFAHRRAQEWQLPLLRQLQIGDERAHRRQFASLERAESVQRGDRVEPGQTRRPPAAVEARSRQRGHRAARFLDQACAPPSRPREAEPPAGQAAPVRAPGAAANMS